jgi:pilus assembly protein Flp/PilA
MPAGRRAISARLADTQHDVDDTSYSEDYAKAVPAARRGHPAACPKEQLMFKLVVSVQNWLSQSMRAGDRGATAVEYGLMVALIAAAIVATVTALGGKLNTLFTSITSSI